MLEFQNVGCNQEIAPYMQNVAFNNYYTYSFISRASYYAMISPQYYSFMNRFVKNWLWWYDGYVPYFHNSEQGIPSTRIATALVNKISKKVVGGRVMYKNAGNEVYTDENGKVKLNKALSFISTQWAKKTDFESVVKRAVKYAASAGTALIKLNKGSVGLWAEALRFDSFLPAVTSQGELSSVKCFLRFFTNLGVKELKENTSFQGYYVVEYRHFADYVKADGTILKDAPVVEYVIHRQNGTVVSGEYLSQGDSGKVPFNSLPTAMRKTIGKCYPDVRFDTPVLLPFKESLGCELVKWTDGVSGLPELPFGESVLSNIIAHLQAWDYYFAAANTDMYLGRGRIIAPKNITRAGKMTNYNSGLDNFLFTKVETTDPESQKPIPIQFDLRSNDWNEIRNRLIQDIAVNIGVNISTIASFLQDSTARTAREISTEENDTAEYVNDQRAIIEKPINKILKLVTMYEGFIDDVVIRWSSAGLTNRYSLAELINTALNGQKPFLSQKKAIEMFNYDDDDAQVQEEYERILDDMKSNQEPFMNFDSEQDLFNEGDLNEDSEQTT